MHLAAGPVSHALIGHDLAILAHDDSYAALLGDRDDALVGRSALDTLHPDDRSAGAALLQRVWREGQAVSVTLRHRRAQGGMIWVDVHVSRLGRPGGAHDGQLAVSCRPLPDGAGQPSTIEAQWQMARMLLQAIDGGKRAFGESLIGNPATELLLLAYVAEAEARTVRAGDLATRIAVSWPLTLRWLIALDDAGFVECEVPGPIEPHSPVRLTPRALAMIEAIFGALVAVIQGSLVPA